MSHTLVSVSTTEELSFVSPTSTPPDDTDLGPPHNVLVQMGTVIPVFFFAPSLPTKYIDPPMFPTVLFISQAVNFCILLIASIVYEAPQGTVQQIDGPWHLEYQTYENMGRIICLHIASWFFSWTYLDFRCVLSPLNQLAFIDSESFQFCHWESLRFAIPSGGRLGSSWVALSWPRNSQRAML